MTQSEKLQEIAKKVAARQSSGQGDCGRFEEMSNRSLHTTYVSQIARKSFGLAFSPKQRWVKTLPAMWESKLDGNG